MFTVSRPEPTLYDGLQPEDFTIRADEDGVPGMNGKDSPISFSAAVAFCVKTKLISEWRATKRLLISQRGWMGNYIFGTVQGVSCAETSHSSLLSCFLKSLSAGCKALD